MATVITTMKPATVRKNLVGAQKQLDTARIKLAAATEAVRLAELNVAECQRNVDTVDTMARAQEEAKARSRAEKEAAMARAKAEKEAAAKAREEAAARTKAEKDAAMAQAKAEKEAAVRARAEAKARAKAEKEASAARAKAERDAAKKKPDGTKVDQAAVDDLYDRYCEIRELLAELSYPEIRARVGQYAEYPRPVIAGVLTRLGYSADGSKAELVQSLLTSLERIKGSIDQTSRI